MGKVLSSMCTTHISGVVHTHPPSTWRQKDQEFQAILSYIEGQPRLHETSS